MFIASAKDTEAVAPAVDDVSGASAKDTEAVAPAVVEATCASARVTEAVARGCGRDLRFGKGHGSCRTRWWKRDRHLGALSWKLSHLAVFRWVRASVRMHGVRRRAVKRGRKAGQPSSEPGRLRDSRLRPREAKVSRRNCWSLRFASAGRHRLAQLFISERFGAKGWVAGGVPRGTFNVKRGAAPETANGSARGAKL
jgi:hypothetical protein